MEESFAANQKHQLTSKPVCSVYTIAVNDASST